MRANKKRTAVAGATLLAVSAFAAPSVEITNVQQQYPWTNTVDITYTVAGVKTHQVEKILLTNETYFVAFEAKTAAGAPIPDVNGNTVFTNALVNGSGQNQTAQWQPKLNLQETGCKITPSVFRGEEDAYLVVNLATNAQGRFEAWFEPMSTQEASNERYNTDEYKISKMVFRKIPKGHPVYIGKTSAGFSVTNNYYVAIFETTRAQHNALLTPGTVSENTSVNRRPITVSYNILRGNASPQASAGDGPITTLNERVLLPTGRGTYFDLPTAHMWEVACRARGGLTTTYYWGESTAVSKLYASGNFSGTIGTHEVGALRPNDMGLYDMAGNFWDMTRDAKAGDNDNKTSPVSQDYFFTPYGTGSYRGLRGGSSYDSVFSHRARGLLPNASFSDSGYRLALYP